MTRLERLLEGQKLLRQARTHIDTAKISVKTLKNITPEPIGRV